MLRTALLRNAMLGVVVYMTGAGVSRAQFQTPGPEHDRFKEQVGTWDIVIDMAGRQTKGTATHKLICGGMWLASDSQGEVLGRKFESHGLDGYNQQKKKYVGVMFDSLSSTPVVMEGTYDPNTKMIVMTGESPGPDGKPVKLKSTTEIKDKDHITVKLYVVIDKEYPSYTVEYTRKK